VIQESRARFTLGYVDVGGLQPMVITKSFRELSFFVLCLFLSSIFVIRVPPTAAKEPQDARAYFFSLYLDQSFKRLSSEPLINMSALTAARHDTESA